MKKLNVRKIISLALMLMILCENVFCARYIGDKTVDFSIEYDAGENGDFLRLLKKLEIFDGEYLPEKNITYEKAAKIFGVFDLNENNESFLTNEDFMCLAAKSFILKADGLKRIYEFYDFALCKAENRSLIEAYLEKFEDIENADGQNLMRPKKVLNEKEFFTKLSYFGKELATKYGYNIINGRVSDLSMMGNEKTISLTTGDEVVTKESDLLLLIGDNVKKGDGAYVFVKENTAYAVETVKLSSNRFKTGGIYKGNVFLYDKSEHKIIFKNLKKYQKGEFADISQKGALTGFDAFSNFLVYENFASSSADKINNFLLDKEAVFFTMIDEYGLEKICYINYVGNGEANEN